MHGDFHIENMLFDDACSVKHIYDFDNIKINHRESEILWSITISFLENSFEDNTQQVKTFLRSYNDIYAIDKSKLKTAINWYKAKLFSSVWAEKQYYLDHNKRVRPFIENDLRRIKYLNEHENKLVGLLTEF